MFLLLWLFDLNFELEWLFAVPIARGPRESDTTPDWKFRGCRTARVPPAALQLATVTGGLDGERFRQTSITLPRNRFTALSPGCGSGVRADLDQRDSRDTIVVILLDDLDDVDELVELLGDLLERVLSADTTMVVRDMSFCSVEPTASTRCEPAPREQRRHASQHTGFVLDQHRKVCVVVDPVMCAAPTLSSRCRDRRRRASGVPLDLVVEERADAAAAWISSFQVPAATIGHTCASAPTMKSITTGRSLIARAWFITSTTSSSRSQRNPTHPAPRPA